MDVWTYFQQREAEVEQLSLDLPDYPVFAAEEGNDHRGRMIATLYFRGFDSETYLKVHEVVNIEGSGVTRVKYAYFLMIDGIEFGGYERDPTHEPAVHMHCSARVEHERLDSDAVSFRDAVTEAWKYVSEHAKPLTAEA